MRQQVSVKLYETLGLSDFSNKQELKRAHKKLCLVHHPDRTGGNLDRMQRINAAYDFLMRHKFEYDKLLREYKERRKVPVQFEFVRPFYPNNFYNFTTTGGTAGGTTWTFHSSF